MKSKVIRRTLCPCVKWGETPYFYTSPLSLVPSLLSCSVWPCSQLFLMKASHLGPLIQAPPSCLYQLLCSALLWGPKSRMLLHKSQDFTTWLLPISTCPLLWPHSVHASPHPTPGLPPTLQKPLLVPFPPFYIMHKCHLFLDTCVHMCVRARVCT
jgi:hypothetical protein